jgi:hypothetical protein
MCETLANGKTCKNGGFMNGTIIEENCACNCSFTDYGGETCEEAVKCTCQNGGLASGTLEEDNCACTCQHGFSG